LGGSSESTWRRVAKQGTGWICGRGGSEEFEMGADQIRSAWHEEGRAGNPQLLAFRFFSLGPGGSENARNFISNYYSYAPFMEALLASTSLTDQMVVDVAQTYSNAGCDELLFFPCSSHLDQVQLLARALTAGALDFESSLEGL
jgi:alkanesulfonate monooxygenase SsuD/methylene tetrahydromethanopterin reductase-like flavin-dependent oxidoreductase (luciferase family)